MFFIRKYFDDQYLPTHTAWKVSVLGDFLFCIFPHSDRIWNRKIPNTDICHAVSAITEQYTYICNVFYNCIHIFKYNFCPLHWRFKVGTGFKKTFLEQATDIFASSAGTFCEIKVRIVFTNLYVSFMFYVLVKLNFKLSYVLVNFV